MTISSDGGTTSILVVPKEHRHTKKPGGQKLLAFASNKVIYFSIVTSFQAKNHFSYTSPL